MPKIQVGSFWIKADTKEELLDYINENWNEFYKREYSKNRFSYDVLNSIDKVYFSPNFNLTKSEAEGTLNALWTKNSEAYIHVKFKLHWYMKYGLDDNENPKQMTLDDYLEEKNDTK